MLLRYGIILSFFLGANLLQAIDKNGNGMCDVWEARFAVGNLDPDGDADGNGVSNRLESIAGTNPFLPSSHFRIRSLAINAGAVITVDAVAGKNYRLFSAATVAGPWQPVGNAILATTSEVVFPAQTTSANRKFFRVEVTDVDSDNDGVSNWAELQLEGLNPNEVDSFGSGELQGDLAFVESWLDQLSNGNLQITATTPNAYEKENLPASITLSRSSSSARPFTLFLRQISDQSGTSGIATTGDFILKNAGNAVVADRFVIPPGESSTNLLIQPVADALSEVPEDLRISVGGSNLNISARINDAQPTEQNTKLLVAYLSPRQGQSTRGSGMAAVRLAGDHASAIVTVNFSNLNSLTSSVHIETPSSATILSIPPFRYNGQSWLIKANQHYTTDQQVLDALLSGNLRFNVYTEMATSGEIDGAFQVVNGSTVFVQPPSPTAITALAGDDLDREIVRFLTQATYGARWQDITEMRARIANHSGDRIAAFGEWIDEQFLLPAPSHQAMSVAGNLLDKSIDPTASLYQRNRQTAWWTIALNSPDQLRQRMTYALSQIFVISDEEPTLDRMAVGMANYYDMLQSHSFGNFRALLEDVTLHTNMGQYLSHLRNQKSQTSNGVILSSPDENFAREIMQLFSIGLVKLHPDGSLILGSDGLPIPTYNQEDITELSKVFTGWSFSKRASSTNSTTVIDNTDFFLGSSYEEHAIRWSHPMKLFPAYHDESPKNFLGVSIPARTNGGLTDLSDTLNALSSHPNTAPFLCRQLIQRFTTATPSAGYIYRVSTAFQLSGGNFATTIKSILLDPEARDLQTANTAVGFGKSKEMLIRHTAVLRALNAKSAIPIALFKNYGYPDSELAKFPAGSTIARFRDTSTALAQRPLGAPSVFNWYRPDFAPAGTLAQNGFFSPEFQIINENSIVRGLNYQYDTIKSTTGQSTTSLPAGVNIAGIPNFSSYDNNSDNMLRDLTDYRILYLAGLDTNLDGAFSNADTTWPDRATKIPEAIERVVDRADLLLCAGSLKARHGNTPSAPRRMILDALYAIRSGSNNSTSATTQSTSMNERIIDALDLIMKSPDFIIQK